VLWKTLVSFLSASQTNIKRVRSAEQVRVLLFVFLFALPCIDCY